METTKDCLAESVVCQDRGIRGAKMSAYNPLILCSSLVEIGLIVFEIWPFKDGYFWADGGFPICGQVLHPTLKL